MPDRHLVNGSHPIPRFAYSRPWCSPIFFMIYTPLPPYAFPEVLSFPSFEHGSFITGLTFCLRPKLGSLALARTGGMDLLAQAVQIAFGNTVNVPQASRGEYPFLWLNPRSASGSSPLTRGILLSSTQNRSRRRFIPAPAGNTNRCLPGRAESPVHPRSRGEYAWWLLFHIEDFGSSPLTRGIPV